MADAPTNKLQMWTIGLYGVNVVDSPIHLIDGEMLAAQNAEPFTEEGDGGLRKRLGISLFTPGTLPAAIAAMTSIPLPDLFVPYPTEGAVIYVLTTTDGGEADYYWSSEDGVTWVQTVTAMTVKFQSPDGGGGVLNSVFQHGGPLTTSAGLNFLDGSAGHLMRWDGTSFAAVTTNELSDVSSMAFCSTLLEHENEIYAIGRNAGATAMVICRLNGIVWEEVVAVDPWEQAQAACSAFGRIYVPSSDQRMGYWSAGSGWVDEGAGSFTGHSTGGTPTTDLVATAWGLVATLDHNDDGDELIWLRAGPDDPWVDITPAGLTMSTFGPMALLDDVLYIGRQIESLLAFVGCEVWKFDGTTVTLDEDLTALVPDAYLMPAMVAFNGALFCTVTATTDPSHNLVSRSSAGVWSLEISEIGISQDAPAGPIGFLPAAGGGGD